MVGNCFRKRKCCGKRSIPERRNPNLTPVRSYQRILWRWRSAKGCWFCRNYSPLLLWRKEGSALPSESQALVFHLHGPVRKPVIKYENSCYSQTTLLDSWNFFSPTARPLNGYFEVTWHRLFPAKSPWVGKLQDLWCKRVTVQCSSRMLTNRWGLLSKFVPAVLRGLNSKSWLTGHWWKE